MIESLAGGGSGLGATVGPRPLRVLHVITGLNVGGAERMLHKLLAHSDRDRFDHQVLSLLARGKIADDLEAVGVAVHSLGLQGAGGAVAGLLPFLSLVRKARPDVIQGWMYHGNLAAWLASRLSPGRVPVLWNIRQSLYDISRERRGTAAVIRLCARLSKAPAHILYNSYTAREHHERLGYCAASGLVIPNGFSTDVFCPDAEAGPRLREELGVGDEAVLVGLVARFDPLKDHSNFLRAAALLASRSPRLHFVLVGRDVDPDNARLMAEIDGLGLGGRLSLLGERHDVPAITAGLDVAVSASLSEAFANAIGEAMGCAVPCVVTDVGDSARILGDGGVIVPPGDASALASGIARLAAMPEAERRALGLRARRRIIEHFSIASVVASYEQLYAGCAAGKGTSRCVV